MKTVIIYSVGQRPLSLNLSVHHSVNQGCFFPSKLNILYIHYTYIFSVLIMVHVTIFAFNSYLLTLFDFFVCLSPCFAPMDSLSLIF